MVDVGGGSMQLSLFDKNNLICTQNILLGSLRIQEFLQDMQKHTDNYQNLVYEYISNDLHTFSELYLKDQIRRKKKTRSRISLRSAISSEPL